MSVHHGPKYASKELQGALDAYRGGKTDGLVVVVSGETSQTVRGEILEAVEKGEIEAVFNVDVWYEGADLHMFTHLLGGRPTFSMYKKAQERGRLNRRGPNDVNRRGELLSDQPKILFDVIDDYHQFDRHLVGYGEVMGTVGYSAVRPGELYDAFSREKVEEINRRGVAVDHEDLEELNGKPTPRPTPPSPRQIHEEDWGPLVSKLWGVFETTYRSDLEVMAWDLGIPADELRGIMEGRGWLKQSWFLKRMATLLYLPRSHFVDLFNEQRGVRDQRVSAEDIEILQRMIGLYEKREGSLGDLRPYHLKVLNSGKIQDRSWREIWRVLANYSLKKSPTSFEELERHFFARAGWSREATTGVERLLLEARRRVALRFGGVLPTETGIEGVSMQISRSPLARWLRGEAIAFSVTLPHHEFYQQISALLVGLGVSNDAVDSLIEEAVFEERGWSRDATTGPKRLLLEARRRVAIKFGGVLPTETGIEGVPVQAGTAPIARWLRDEEIAFSINLPPSEFYRQVRALLVGLGIPNNAIDSLIEEAVFEERGWSRDTMTGPKRLLLEARRRVAIKFGGVLPTETGIEGIPKQHRTAPLTLWVRGEEIVFSRHFRPSEHNRQVKALLVGLGVSNDAIDSLIEEAVFEEHGWSRDVTTGPERLLLEVRRLVAIRFGGVLPRETGIEGVPMQAITAPLTRWLTGERIAIVPPFSPHKFHQQMRALLTHEGFLSPEAADRLIAGAGGMED